MKNADLTRRLRITAAFAFCTTLAIAASETCQAQSKPEPATIKPVPREGAWMNMHEAFLKRAKEGNIDLLFLGDSITQGWRGHEGEGKTWTRQYGARNAANFGIGGDRTEHVLWRLDHGEIDGIKPKVVVLMIGTNNAGSNTSAEIALGITAIVEKLRAKLPETKILLLGVFPRGQAPNPFREKLKDVNARIARLDDGKMINYLDIGRHFVNEDGTISADVMPDFLHLSSKGYKIWADAMEPTLWSMLEEK